MSISKFLAVDLGAESGRAIVGVLENGKIWLHEVHRFQNEQIKRGGHLHWDAKYLFNEIKRGISLAVKNGHSSIESIGIDTWGVDYGLIGHEGNLLGDPYCYRDGRTDGMMEKLFSVMPPDELYSRTGIQFMQINTLIQLYSEISSNKNFCRDVKRLLFMPDLFNYFLTGKMINEYTISSTSQMLNANKKIFDTKILSALNIKPAIFGKVVMPGTVIGKLLPEISKETEAGAIDVIAVGSHDTASAVAAVPASGNDWAYLSSGTWSLLGIENDGPIINYQLNKDFTNEGAVGGKIRFLRNTSGLWFLQELRKSWSRNGEELSYENITSLAACSIGTSCRIDPDHKLFLNPPDMREAILKYCDETAQKKPENIGDYARTVLESLAFKYSGILKKIEDVSDKKINKIHIVGGGSQNKLLNQLTANATGKTVFAGPTEATALGNILVQAVAKGKIKSFEETRKISADSFPTMVFMPVGVN